MTTQRSQTNLGRTPVEVALRHLGARQYGNLIEIIEHAIKRPDGRTGTILAPLTEATSVLEDWTSAERAHALWRVIEEGIVDPQVGPTAQSRRRRTLQAAFRIPDDDIAEKWGASLTDRFKQLMKLGSIFGNATSTQPMEIAWKRGVGRLADHLDEVLGKLSTPEDWACYRPAEPSGSRLRSESTTFRQPSEGAQKLSVNLLVMTVIMRGRVEARRITERVITSQDERGLRYYTARAYSSGSLLRARTYVPTHALGGCRAEQATQDGIQVTRLWFPRPLMVGEQAHFMSEVICDDDQGDVLGWHGVDIDHYGIEPGSLRDGLWPMSGLTIRIKFESDSVPRAVWWYAEQNEQERYTPPPEGSPRRLDVVCGDVVQTFTRPCQPREGYGIAYVWS